VLPCFQLAKLPSINSRNGPTQHCQREGGVEEDESIRRDARSVRQEEESRRPTGDENHVFEARQEGNGGTIPIQQYSFTLLTLTLYINSWIRN